ncbi:three component ABC system middle component [Marinifilum flexuosum]|uniref:Uncharacterized protein n=1 Tax=Marinifilum flexuosum TaxID=1117708 RepID=A0A419WFC2_9BACT|nr:three component ABC system middle component [Marinifilum flexuosum]RKD94085.1 hypothetical protein BXY64_4248 [Marinifilum flexuosum]
MKNNIHNNEAISAAVLSSFIKEYGEIEYAKIVLILPFLLNPNLVRFLKNKRTIIRSFEELIAKKGDLLINFTARFNELLPVSINAIYILSQLKYIKFEDGKIEHNKLLVVNSKRVEEIKAAIPTLSSLFSENTSSMYLKLRIQL